MVRNKMKIGTGNCGYSSWRVIYDSHDILFLWAFVSVGDSVVLKLTRVGLIIGGRMNGYRRSMRNINGQVFLERLASDNEFIGVSRNLV